MSALMQDSFSCWLYATRKVFSAFKVEMFLNQKDQRNQTEHEETHSEKIRAVDPNVPPRAESRRKNLRKKLKKCIGIVNNCNF